MLQIVLGSCSPGVPSNVISKSYSYIFTVPNCIASHYRRHSVENTVTLLDTLLTQFSFFHSFKQGSTLGQYMMHSSAAHMQGTHGKDGYKQIFE